MMVKDKVTLIISEIMNRENIIINDNTNLIDDFEFDSIQMVSLIVELESEFNIVFSDEELALEQIANVKNLISLIEIKVRK